MNFKDPKIQIISFIVVLFLVATYMWYVKVYSAYAARITTQKALYNKELADLQTVKQKAATLDELQREYEELQLKYKRVELLLPEIKEDEAFLNQIHAAAQLTGSMVMSITPMGTQVGEFYQTNAYSVEVQSSYHGLGEFFAKVANFPFIVNVSDLEMKATTGGLAATLDNTPRNPNRVVTALFKMSTYNVKQGATG